MPEKTLAELKVEADNLGITYHHKIGSAKLQELIATKTKKEPLTQMQLIAERKKAASKLVRVIVSCNDPNKIAYPGEVVSAGSAKLGHWQKYIPFNNPEGWHVPQILLDAMNDKEYVKRVTETRDNREITRNITMPLYNIQVLPKLTIKEVQELKQRQAMANGTAEK